MIILTTMTLSVLTKNMKRKGGKRCHAHSQCKPTEFCAGMDMTKKKEEIIGACFAKYESKAICLIDEACKSGKCITTQIPYHCK